MADGNTSTQSNQNSGSGGGAFRDVNASVGALELPISVGNAQSGSTAGNITVSGDVISGNQTRFGLAKMLILGGMALGLMWIWRRK